ncbi:MAG: pseudouridine synthase [Desulfuromonas sp.]|nr:MAG: pseudouridine synthase [Desulfuromonas sp.]
MSQEEVRLQKFLAQAGVASRRQAERLIVEGRVLVNGVRAELGMRVLPETDRVDVDGRRVRARTDQVYLLLNKPTGFLTTRSDPQGRPIVYSLLGEDRDRVQAVGRLDFNTEGALLFTNDGELARRLQHPRFKVTKTYQVRVRGKVSDDVCRRLAAGVVLDDGPTLPAKVRRIRGGGSHSLVEISLREGRNRQVRRMCEAVGCPVSRLRRTQIGPVDVGNLPLGEVRRLRAGEIAALKKATGMA